jgi:hypothetical protein
MPSPGCKPLPTVYPYQCYSPETLSTKISATKTKKQKNKNKKKNNPPKANIGTIEDAHYEHTYTAPYTTVTSTITSTISLPHCISRSNAPDKL